MILFRVDANEQIASGHLMRCIVIARKLKKLDEDVMFCMAEEKFTNKLEMNDLPYVILGSKWDDMHCDLPKMIELIDKYKASWVVVDSYQVDKNYLEALEKHTKVAYFDDMQKDVYNISTVINYTDWLEDNSYMERYSHLKTHVMCGMDYVPLREEFYAFDYIKDVIKDNVNDNSNSNINNNTNSNINSIENSNINKKVDRISDRYSFMITTGGIDTYNIACRLLKEVVKDNELSNQEYNVIVGQMNQNKSELQEIEKENPNIHLYYDINNMGDFMRASDVAISAGGTTLFELCACKIPTICFSFAENQEELPRKMGAREIMLYAGDARFGVDNVIENIIKNLKQLITYKAEGENTLRNNLIEKMGMLVDGKGADRIAEAIMQ